MVIRDYSDFAARSRIPANTCARTICRRASSPDLWINMQTQHDLSKAAIETRDQLAAIKTLEAPAKA